MKICNLLFGILMGTMLTPCFCQENQKQPMLFQKIPKSEYDAAILYYADQAMPGTTVLEVLENSKRLLMEELDRIPDNKITFQYGFGKWSVGEVLQHIISYERFMTERALIIAGLIQSDFKYQSYTQASTAAGGSDKSKAELIRIFLAVREQTIRVFANFTPDQLQAIGYLDGFKTSVRMICLCLSGHQVHHFNVLKNRYKVL